MIERSVKEAMRRDYESGDIVAQVRKDVLHRQEQHPKAYP